MSRIVKRAMLFVAAFTLLASASFTSAPVSATTAGEQTVTTAAENVAPAANNFVIEIAPICLDQAKGTLYWSVTNKGDKEVTVTWATTDNSRFGTIVIVPGKTNIATLLSAANVTAPTKFTFTGTVTLLLNATKACTPATMPNVPTLPIVPNVPQVPVPNKIDIEVAPLCIDLQTRTLRWAVTNNKTVKVTLSWATVDGSRSGVIDVEPGKTDITTLLSTINPGVSTGFSFSGTVTLLLQPILPCPPPVVTPPVTPPTNPNPPTAPTTPAPNNNGQVLGSATVKKQTPQAMPTTIPATGDERSSFAQIVTLLALACFAYAATYAYLYRRQS